MDEKDSSFLRWLPALLWLPVAVLAFVMWSWERKPMRSDSPSPIRYVDVQVDRRL